jgi:hypothetical protein
MARSPHFVRLVTTLPVAVRITTHQRAPRTTISRSPTGKDNESPAPAHPTRHGDPNPAVISCVTTAESRQATQRAGTAHAVTMVATESTEP